MKTIKISPSILSADFSKLGEEIRALEAAGADMIHVDVMDGHFVPNLTIGAPVIKDLRKHTSLPFDVHLMISEPEKYIKDFAEAGADIITVHAEACGKHLPSVLESIKALGVKAGVSLKPSTLPDVAGHVFDHIDLVLVMTVEPGFGGQSFMDDQMEKVRTLRKWINDYGHNIILEVDGGINPQTIELAARAGADAFVAGSAVFKDGQYEENIHVLRTQALRAIHC